MADLDRSNLVLSAGGGVRAVAAARIVSDSGVARCSVRGTRAVPAANQERGNLALVSPPAPSAFSELRCSSNPFGGAAEAVGQKGRTRR